MMNPERYSDSLDRIKNMPKGWNYGCGGPPTQEAMDTASYFSPCPLDDGGIQIDFHAGGIDLEIEIGPDGKVRAICWYPAKEK